MFSPQYPHLRDHGERKEPMYEEYTKIGKESENSYQKMKRYLGERHTQTHGSLTETF